MSNNLNKDFEQWRKKVEASLKKLPLLVASDAQNFFLDSFKRTAWIGQTTENWKPRKPNKKRTGAALLVKTGRLKRSIRIKRAKWNSIVIGSDVPYAGVHNEGLNETQTVHEHSRIASRKVATRYNKAGHALKSGMKKIRGKSHQVSSFTRNQNIPRRRFMGNSPYLNQRILRTIISQLMKINKK